MLTIKRISILFVLLFLFFWTILAFSRTLYNASKVFKEGTSLTFLSENQKYSLIYGDLLPIYKKINTINQKNSIYLITQDGKAYFLLRYLLYPKKIYWVNSTKSIPNNNNNNNNNSFLLFYHQNQKISNGDLIFSTGRNKNISNFYKL